MPLQIPSAPPTADQALQAGMQRLPAHKKTMLFGAAGGAGVAEPAISLPHQVFLLHADDVLGGATIESSEPVAWRYLVDQQAPPGGAPAKATAEVSATESGHRFTHIQQGWIGEATLKVVQSVASRPEVAQGSFDLRLLRIPSLLVDALWLKNNRPGEDLVQPIASADKALDPALLYSASEFLIRLRDIASRKRRFDNRPPERAR